MNYLRLKFLFLGVLAAACGDKGVDTEGTATDTTTADPPDTTTDGSPTATGITGTDGATDGTTDGTTGEPACVDPSLTDIGPPVEVTLRNNGATRLFINLADNCASVLPFGLRDANDVEVEIDKDACEFGCDDILSGECGCAAGCGPGQVLQLEPGGTFLTGWTGRVWSEATLPAECSVGGCGSVCTAAAQAPMGIYMATARAHDAIVDCDTCTCFPEPEGSCVIGGGFAMGAEVLAESPFMYPMHTGLDIVFE